jgi:3-hydroxyisobutyrate dehydrogenase-like beta-hydroxyacid dehydrogenase
VTIVGYDPVPERVRTLGDGVVAAPTPEEAVSEADVVVTAGPIVQDPSSP